MATLELLSMAEIRELEQHEAVIERGLKTFEEVGIALLTIRDKKLYKAYATFEDYCFDRWGFSRTHAYRLIDAATIVGNLKMSPYGDILPEAEAHVRPLTQLEPPQQREAWQRAIDTAPNGKVTGPHVRRTVNDMRREEVEPVTVDVPIVARPAPPPKRQQDFITLQEWQAMSEQERHNAIAKAARDSRSMNKQTTTNIEWALWSWNPVTGCKHNCPYCYARDIANRFYEQGFEPVLLPGRLSAPLNIPVPDAAAHNIGEKNVFTCSMADLFGRWVPQEWIDGVLTTVRNAPQWNFLFLTKFPIRMSEQEWPDNAWVGTSVDSQIRVAAAEKGFRNVRAGVKWLSCEPLMERLTFTSLEMFDWIVIGGATKSTQTPEFQPPWEWVEHLVRQARDAGCKVYFKTNLRSRPMEYPGQRMT